MMKKQSRKDVCKKIDTDLACYVLLTCSHPSPEGQMQVNMTYEGDATLAAYLLEGAQSFIDQKLDTAVTISTYAP
jgi:hypothetical protein